jgi:hypothetical protein
MPIPPPIEDAINRLGILIGRERLYAQSEASQLLGLCDQWDVAAVGADAFVVRGGTVLPIIDQIADFSDLGASDWQAYRSQVNRLMEQFLRQLPPGNEVRVSLVLMSHDEWRGRRLT